MANPPRVLRRRRAPGWYADPWRVAQRRWWDGQRWTSRVDEPLDLTAPQGPSDEAPAPPGRLAHPSQQGARRSHRRRLPYDPRRHLPGTPDAEEIAGFDVRALAPAFVALAVGAPATFLLLLLAQESLPGRPVGEAAAFLALWVALIVATVWASRRTGSGDLRRDTGLHWQPIDMTTGVVVALAVVLVHGLVVRVIAATVIGGLGPRSGFVTPPFVQSEALVLLTLLLTALVGPLAEELFFRGVVQQAIASRFGAAAGIIGQALAAGAVHANPGLGEHTLSVVVGSAGAAVVYGVARQATGRLGPGLVGHSLYEVLVVVALLRGA